MIVQRYRDGRHVSIGDALLADIADQDRSVAAVVFKHTDETSAKNALERVLHVHKIRCLEAAEHKLGGPSVTGWFELYMHVLRVVHNIGLPPEDLLRRQEELEAPFQDED